MVKNPAAMREIWVQSLDWEDPLEKGTATQSYILLLLLSRFSRVRLYATPEMAAHQAPPSLGFSRQEHTGVGCHFLQCMKVKSESEVAQQCLILSDSMDCSPPGSSVHGIFQARVLESGAMACWNSSYSQKIDFPSQMAVVRLHFPACLRVDVIIVTEFS